MNRLTLLISVVLWGILCVITVWRGKPGNGTDREGTYQIVSFDFLGGFNYLSSQDLKRITPHFKNASHTIPTAVLAFQGRPVRVEGYILSSSVQSLDHFILVPHLLSCCFGGTAQMNQWIEVTASPPSQKAAKGFNMEVPVRAYGVLKIGEQSSPERGTSLYRLQVDTLAQAKSRYE